MAGFMDKMCNLSHTNLYFGLERRARIMENRAFGSSSGLFAHVGCFMEPERGGTGHGISAYRINPTTGAWRSFQKLEGLVNPSWLLTNRGGSVLYSLHADEDYVSSYHIDRVTGRLTPLNRANLGGRNAVSAKLDSTEKFLIVANYASGSVSVLPVGADGSLEKAIQVFDLPGEARERHRVDHQGSSHPHDIVIDPTGRFVVVPDKGLDRVFVLKFDPNRGQLSLSGKGYMDVRSGSGPRHMAFHPNLPVAWVLNELNSTLTTCHWNGRRGALSPIEVVSTLPGDFTDDTQTAEIEFIDATSTLYISNRGHNSIVLFRVNRTTGLPRLIGWQPSGGGSPRFFAPDPDGRSLFVGNWKSGTIRRLDMESKSGALTLTRQTVKTPSPCAIVFI